jgi:hypothetical protein
MHLSSFLDLLLEQVEAIASRRFWMVVLGLVSVVVILTNGISLVPGQFYQRLSENPFVTRTDVITDSTLQETVLLPIIAFFTKLNSPLAFSILCLSLIAGAYLLFAISVFRRSGSLVTLVLSAILITSPLTTILLTWLGMPDGLTVLLITPFLFTSSVSWIFVVAILGTTNHIAFLIAAIEIVVLRWIARDHIRIMHLAAIALGGVIGFISVEVFLAVHHIQVVSRLEFILTVSLIQWLRMNLVQFPMTMFSLFNVQWLIIPVCLIMCFKTDRRYYSCFLGMLLFNYGITFFSLDTTRIFSLLSWGILMSCVFHSFSLVNREGSASRKQLLQALIVIALLSFIAPRYYVWAGSIGFPPFYAFLREGIQ